MTRYLILLLFPAIAWAQKDSLAPVSLNEVVIISQKSPLHKAAKTLGSVDDYLTGTGPVNMIRRGNYAWEPLINGMSSERGLITLDGMRIYGACTDKMDPVTSYVEITNLAKATVHSGQSGSAGGATIAGSIDLSRRKTGFSVKQSGGDAPGETSRGEASRGGMVFTGFETNNRQKIAGFSLFHSGEKLFADVDFTFRDAENYRAGGKREIEFSPFTKYNVSVISGWKIAEHRELEASLIYDRAVHVGYPALPMDVGRAEALMASAEYIRHHVSGSVDLWKTKLYHNAVTHIMDDSRRPDVPIRMDMPGRTRTTGFYSLLEGASPRHSWKMNLSGHTNYSLAEMTMFSNTPGEKEMFMLTWPGVSTQYLDLYREDTFHFTGKTAVALNLGLAAHHNRVGNLFGLESLRIFYPAMSQGKTRTLKRISSSVQHRNHPLTLNFGLAYGERAPGVSEGYGFYLFNSFDRFDYIGNPDLKNEKSAEVNAAASFKRNGFSVKLSGAYFHILDYIIGKPDLTLSTMTIGASGVKIYEQLPYAQIMSTDLEMSYRFTPQWSWRGRLSYQRGSGKGAGNLPLMQPLTYVSGLAFSTGKYAAELTLNGAAQQKYFSAGFGETPASAYRVIHLSGTAKFRLFQLKAGVENLLDAYYSTYTDWNRIPRMGRNVFFNVIRSF
ncbi:MAG: TonB-dependent receptor [Leadbetterella sp.]|nr:TonB-dependent receptor [Leadbetterella sp.]